LYLKTKGAVLVALLSMVLLLSGCFTVVTEVSLSEFQQVADDLTELYVPAVFGFEIGDGETDDEEFIKMMIEDLFGGAEETSYLKWGGRDLLGMELPIPIINPTSLGDLTELGELTILAGYEEVEGQQVLALRLWLEPLQEATEELGAEDLDESDSNFSLTLRNDLADEVTVYVNAASLNDYDGHLFTGDLQLKSGELVELNFLNLFSDDLIANGTRLLALIKK